MKIKKFLALGLGLIFSHAIAQNTLLERNFWENKPQLETVKAEIKKGNNPAEANPANFDATTLAILQNAPIEVIKYLIDLEGNGITKSTHDSRTYLHWAAFKGNAELTEWLLKKGASVQHTDSRGNTPLAYATLGGLKDTKIYDLFLNHGVNIRQKYKDGAEIFHYAISNDDENLTITNYFLSKGVPLEVKDNLGRNIADYASKGQNLNLLKKLIEKGIKPSSEALLFAARGSKKWQEVTPFFNFLINDLKISINTTDAEGNNALHYALSGRGINDDMVQFFIEQGTSYEQANQEGDTPLMKAFQRNKTDLVQLMLSKGVGKINATNKKGISALGFGVQYASPELVETLIKKGADINTTDQKGNHLGLYLVESYNKRDKNALESIISKIKILTDKGVDLTKPQEDGNTLAHLVVQKQEPKLLAVMKPYIKDINAKNNEGLTALHLSAMISKDLEMIKLLLENGSDKSLKTSLDETAYDLAIENEILGKNKSELEFLK
ncbi:ankyrin repeat domain-containing protein [Riemerella anatipestifer]